MEFGAHLPLMDFGGHPYTLQHLVDYTKTAARLGLTVLSANDHLVFDVPWLDGPTALAATMEHSAGMTLATTVALAVVRGPVPVAKTLGAIDRLSGGRVLVAVGPGSSHLDYRSVGIDFEERWRRLDEAVMALRALWGRDAEPFVGRFYSTEDLQLMPSPAQPGGPPIWIGSWGSDAGLRRVARLADGWLASAYNTTPDQFKVGLGKLRDNLKTMGKDPESFPNALVTMFMFVTEDRTKVNRVLSEVLGAMLKLPLDQLSERLLVGSPEACAEKLAAYQLAGVQRIFLWPI